MNRLNYGFRLSLAAATLVLTLSRASAATDAINQDNAHPSSTVEATSQSAQIASEAIREIEDNVFSRAHLKAAAYRIEQAATLNPNEPMVYVAWASLIRVMGFRSGDWHYYKNFQPGSLDKAAELARKALDLANGKPVPEAHIMLARVLISKEQFAEAQTQLDIAKAENADAYKYHFVQAALFRLTRSFDRSLEEYAAAEKYAVTDVDKTRILQNRSRIQEIKNDIKGSEDAHKKVIQIAPEPQSYGNYGYFLLRNGHCSEALTQFETGLRLGSYPLGEKGLAEAQACLKKAK